MPVSDLNGTVWQVAAGPWDRDYTDVFLRYGVALIGPGDPGPWRPESDDADFGGSIVRQFASENEMPFLDISAKAGLVSEDFADARGHIGNRPARERCTGVLASRVAHLLTESLDP